MRFGYSQRGWAPGSAAPDGRFGWMRTYNVVLCPVCRAGVVRGSRCRDCGRVAL